MEAFEAVFANGVFRPVQPVMFPENSRVRLTPECVDEPLDQDLDAIYAVMDLRFNSGEHDVAERHNEHQP